MKIDARKLSREELYELRRGVIRLLEEGVPVMQIVARTGLSWAAVNAAIRKSQTEGTLALLPEPRGKKSGTGRALTKEQEAEIRQCIRKRRPLHFRLKNSLWDRESIRQLVAQKYGVALSERAIGNYLRRWGLAPKGSKLREADRCSKDVRQWLGQNYAQVIRMAQEEDAEICWLRKSVAIDADAWGQSSASKEAEAEMPALRTKKLSMVMAATNQGKLRWAVMDVAFNAERQLKFVKALIRDIRKKKVFLIRGDLKLYNSPDFIRWIKTNDDTIKIFP